ncbi:MAG: PepSY-associated TM helix domain-containing protein [Bacteroidales bacterium]|jgi:hypothetical protein|nr:PepSY-associated TM helix domain-containing protein [Bacteroidales bacterium]
MKFKWRKWNRAIHRDLGYLFAALTVIYAISGIAVNHIDDWNPNYDISGYSFTLSETQRKIQTKEDVIAMLKSLDEEELYKKHYFPSESSLKIFLKGGTAWVDLESGKGSVDKLKRRPVFHFANYLHYNPGKWWTWVADAFAGALIILALSGLFILKGKNGMLWRGTILTVMGIVIPLIFLVMFYL